jgi:membrane protease YdiL (CAAX protease family)
MAEPMPDSSLPEQPSARPEQPDARPDPTPDGSFPYATWGPWVALAVTFGALIFGLILSLPFFVTDPGSGSDDLSLTTRIATQVCTAVGFIVVPLMLAQLAGGPLRAALRRLGFVRFRIGNTVKWVVIGIVVYLVFLIVYSIVIGVPEQDDIASDFGPIWVQILLIGIAAPISEEVCFRGMLFGGIRTRLPLWSASLAAGIVFGVLHYSTGWSAVGPLIALGVIFAVVYEKTGSIWAPIGMHALNNGIALVALNS